MKKTFLFLATLFAFGAAGFAQVSVIPKAGFTLSTISLPNNSGVAFEEGDVMSLSGFVAGIGFNVPIAGDGFFSVQPELLYIQKGYKVEAAVDQGSLVQTDSYNYLEVPVLARINFGSERVKLYVNAGPSFGYALNGRFTQNVTVGPLSLSTEGKNIFKEEPDNSIGDDEYLSPKYFNRVDTGVQFGGGLGLKVGPGAVLLDARYGMGLTNFFKGNRDNGTSNDDQANVQNRVFAFTLGYAIPLGGK
jgi:hypothetical protein